MSITVTRLLRVNKIAELSLDDYALERQSSAYVSYLDALEAVKTAQKAKTDADIAMWQGRQAIFDAETERDNMINGDLNPATDKAYTDSERAVVEKTVIQKHQAFDSAQLAYNDADASIRDAQTKVSAAWQDYQEVASTIIAPANGVINSLTLTPGVVIESTTSTNSNNNSSATSAATVTSQTIGIVSIPDVQFQATLDLTESDITKVSVGQKATLTLDAFPDNNFTGTVFSIDTSGSVSSGVTSYRGHNFT